MGDDQANAELDDIPPEWFDACETAFWILTKSLGAAQVRVNRL
jgi:hypothetical protein